MSSNSPNDLLGRNVNKTLESTSYSLLTVLQSNNTTSVIYKRATFLPLPSVVILQLVLPSNFIFSDVTSSR